jgi:hypothetical protein
LFNKIIEGISIDEAAFFGIMAVKIKVEGETILFFEINGKLFDGIDSRLLLEVRIDIKSI